MTKYHVVSSFKGFRHKTDETNMPEGTLVVGSQNVLLNDGDRVASRKGYVLDGQANAALTPIVSSYDWQRHIGVEAHLRSYTDNLEFRFVASDGTVTWETLEDGWGDSVNFNYAEFWDDAEEIDVLLLVNGTANIYEWSGAVATFASATAATITLEGTETWGELGFFTAGTRQVNIGGITYTYTGGEGTTTITGVTPNPTLGGHSAGDVIVQTLRAHANGAATGLALAKNDLIATLNNQVYVGDFANRSVYVSQVNDFTDYSFASPRLVGEGAILTLDGCPVGFAVQEEFMYITAGKDQWYQTNFALSADNTAQTLTVLRLKTTAQAAAQSQALISKIKNFVFYVTNEPTLDSLGKIELIDTPSTNNISDPIKTDFDSYDFTGGQCFYFKNFILVAIPAEGIVRIFNLNRALRDSGAQSVISLNAQSAITGWEAPQTLPISRFALIDGQLYGHSSQVPETYQMFVGYNDNGNPIAATAAFSYQQFGDRANSKNFNEYYNEGYISSNTRLFLEIVYNYLGCGGTVTKWIDGSDPIAVCQVGEDGSLGKQSLGTKSLAGRGTTTDETLPPKYRVIKTFPKTDFYEQQTVYSSNGIDQRWELLAWGPNAMMSTSTNANIKE